MIWDNDTKHTSKVAQGYYKKKSIKTLDWPVTFKFDDYEFHTSTVYSGQLVEFYSPFAQQEVTILCWASNAYFCDQLCSLRTARFAKTCSSDGPRTVHQWNYRHSAAYSPIDFSTKTSAESYHWCRWNNGQLEQLEQLESTWNNWNQLDQLEQSW